LDGAGKEGRVPNPLLRGECIASQKGQAKNNLNCEKKTVLQPADAGLYKLWGGERPPPGRNQGKKSTLALRSKPIYRLDLVDEFS
jgi:hypothetical protein